MKLWKKIKIFLKSLKGPDLKGQIEMEKLMLIENKFR